MPLQKNILKIFTHQKRSLVTIQHIIQMSTVDCFLFIDDAATVNVHNENGE